MSERDTADPTEAAAAPGPHLDPRAVPSRPSGEPERAPRPPRRRRRVMIELAIVLAGAITLAAAVQSYAVKPYEIPSGSMQPTLEIGERVLVDRFSERVGAEPDIGEIIVFNPPLSAVPEEQDPSDPIPRCAERAGGPSDPGVCAKPHEQRAEKSFIKRVVAGPGDRIRIEDGTPIVNGERLEEPWETLPCGGAAGCDFPREVEIPADHWFVMGDNRSGSDDSRFWGPVPRDWIIGHAFASYWPPNRVGGR